MRSEGTSIVHPIPPTYDEHSEILILGSFPSPKSRESGYFYGHPRNRFWRVVATIFSDDIPDTVEQKRAFLLRHHIAAWDVIHSCVITGASDSSIRDVTVNDLSPILEGAPIRKILVNGQKAGNLYQKYTQPRTGRAAVVLPSTSPANAAWSLERLISVWKKELLS